MGCVGPVGSYTKGETLLKTFDNPIKDPWDHVTAQTGVFVRFEGKDNRGPKQFRLAVNCAHLGCPFRGSHSRGCLCAPVMAAFTTPPANRRRDRRRGDCSVRWRNGRKA